MQFVIIIYAFTEFIIDYFRLKWNYILTLFKNVVEKICSPRGFPRVQNFTRKHVIHCRLLNNTIIVTQKPPKIVSKNLLLLLLLLIGSTKPLVRMASSPLFSNIIICHDDDRVRLLRVTNVYIIILYSTGKGTTHREHNSTRMHETRTYVGSVM